MSVGEIEVSARPAIIVLNFLVDMLAVVIDPRISRSPWAGRSMFGRLAAPTT